MSLTGQDKYRKGFEPLLEEVTFVPRNNLEALRAAVNDQTCAIVLEPIFGEGGILECSVEFLQECRALADRFKAALIFDEIQCGLGRTGTLFAFQTFGVKPDIVAIAKPIAAGLPLGAFLAREEFASAISAGQHGTTFGGGPLACRVALEYLAIVEEEKLLENVARVGAYLHHELQQLVDELRSRERSTWARLHSRHRSGNSRPARSSSKASPRECCSTAHKTRWCASSLRSCCKSSTWIKASVFCVSFWEESDGRRPEKTGSRSSPLLRSDRGDINYIDSAAPGRVVCRRKKPHRGIEDRAKSSVAPGPGYRRAVRHH